MSNQSKIAASQLARKIKLENQFKPKLKRFFDQLSKDINITWVATGNIPILSPFEPELVTLLRDHYRRVAKAFNREVSKEIKGAGLNLETKQEHDGVDNDILKYIMSHSITQAGIILATTTKEMQAIVAQVIVNSSLSDTPLTQLQIGNQIKQRFVNRTGGRVDTIAITETNTTAERVKIIEREAMSQLLRQESPNQILVNTWNTTLDERTRPAHVLADRQVVKQGEAFKVGGELLRYPGDMSLGASLGNVINCRCSAVSSLEKTDTAISLDPAIPLISTTLN